MAESEIRYQVTWTPFDDELAAALLRPTPGPIYYDGPEVEAFEEEVAAYLGVTYGVGVSSGTAALHLAMLALGLGPGDDVVMPANGYVALPECTLQVGARPVYADVLEATGNVDLSTIEPVVTEKTKAIIVLHYYGHPVDMDPIVELALERGIFVIEDAAHALGGTYRGRKLGTIGDVGLTSFARKCIHIAGQGGMAFTDNPEWALRMRQLRRHGWPPGDEYRTEVAALGFNYTLSECLAAVGRVQLNRLERYREKRAENARKYTQALAVRGIPVHPNAVESWAEPAWLHYVVRAPQRDALLAYLRERGVACKIHYKSPCYRQPVFIAHTGEDPGPRPVTDRLAREIITLPSHPDMGDGIDFVVGCLEDFYS